MADPRSIFGLDGTPDEVVATAAMIELLGVDTIEMVYMRRDGKLLREIAERFDLSAAAVAKRLEVAELRIERMREHARALLQGLSQD